VGGPVEVEFSTLERGLTLSDRVTERLLGMITSAALKPGDRLPSERDLAARLGVSRTVVREAMRSLAAKGVLEVRTGSGAVVGRVDAERASEALRLYVQSYQSGADGLGIDYAQIDDVREMLEARVARISATTASRADLSELTTTHNEFEAAQDDPESASRLDVAFHRLIAVSTHNPLYLVMLDSIEPLLLEIRRKTLGVPGRPGRAVKAHAKILERIVAGDPVGAEAAMVEHLEDSRAVWQGKSFADADAGPTGSGVRARSGTPAKGGSGGSRKTKPRSAENSSA
jgi:GntR family transcriptional regulator, transcriptional repressor for pyruvate dehydrogenase complex